MINHGLVSQLDTEVIGAARHRAGTAVTRPQAYGCCDAARLSGLVLEAFGVQDGDAAACEADQAAVGEVPQGLGAGLAGGAGQRRELLVGEGDLRVAPAGPQGSRLGLGGGEGGQGRGDALRQRLRTGR